MLLATADVCRRLPALLEAFSQGQISWGQVRTLVLQVLKLPRATTEQLDAALAELITRTADADPDDLGHLARWLITEHTDACSEDEVGEAQEVREFLALQPRLDGTGGKFFGEAGPDSFAILENATNPGPPARTGRRFGDRIRIDDDRRRRRTEEVGRARLRRLIDRLDHACDEDQRPVPTLLVAASLDSLCDRDQTPARLLHHLAGGRMYLNSSAAKRLLDERGADLRTTVIDDCGAVVGIGRRRRVPPGWLSEGLLALHDTCSEPGCTTASLSSPIDHAQPWHPARPGDPPGRTDVDNLAPLCTSANRTKEPDGWTCIQTADGVRRWRHPRTGLTVTTIPTALRPADRPGAGPDPPI